MAIDVRSMVDAERGLVSKSIFVEEDVYQQELERIFARCWLLPGECAMAHRHTPTAIRWTLTGKGAYTTVEGDKCYMEPGDLTLTPSWTWHDHANEGAEPMIWLDGLDALLVHYLKASFFEQFPEDQQPVTGVGESIRKYASGALRPAWEESENPYSPLWSTSGTARTMR